MICAPVVNIGLLLELFDHRHPMTIYRWNTPNSPGKQLPAPDFVLGGVELWTVETILSWARDSGEPVNPTVLDRILVEQS